MKTRTGIPNLIKHELKDDLTNSYLEKAELLADYFSSVFTRVPQENTPEEPIRCYKYSRNMYYQPINSGIKTIKKTKNI